MVFWDQERWTQRGQHAGARSGGQASSGRLGDPADTGHARTRAVRRGGRCTRVARSHLAGRIRCACAVRVRPSSAAGWRPGAVAGAGRRGSSPGQAGQARGAGGTPRTRPGDGPPCSQPRPSPRPSTPLATRGTLDACLVPRSGWPCTATESAFRPGLVPWRHGWGGRT